MTTIINYLKHQEEIKDLKASVTDYWKLPPARQRSIAGEVITKPVCEGTVWDEDTGEELEDPCGRTDNVVWVEGEGYMCPDHRD